MTRRRKYRSRSRSKSKSDDDDLSNNLLTLSLMNGEKDDDLSTLALMPMFQTGKKGGKKKSELETLMQLNLLSDMKGDKQEGDNDLMKYMILNNSGTNNDMMSMMMYMNLQKKKKEQAAKNAANPQSAAPPSGAPPSGAPPSGTPSSSTSQSGAPGSKPPGEKKTFNQMDLMMLQQLGGLNSKKSGRGGDISMVKQYFFQELNNNIDDIPTEIYENIINLKPIELSKIRSKLDLKQTDSKYFVYLFLLKDYLSTKKRKSEIFVPDKKWYKKYLSTCNKA